MRLIKNVALIGMPGSGKTAVAKKLASLLGLMSVDTDELIEFEVGMTPAQIFDKHGEKIFREYETKALSSAVKMENIIISTGGGIVENKANIDLLSDCYVIYLSASKNALISRLRNTDRPLLRGNLSDKLDSLYNKRKNLYLSCRDMTVYTSAISVNTAAKKIYDILLDLNIAEN